MSIWINDLYMSIEKTCSTEMHKYSEDALVSKGMDIYHQTTDSVSTRMNFSLTLWGEYSEQPEIWVFGQHAYI